MNVQWISNVLECIKDCKVKYLLFLIIVLTIYLTIFLFLFFSFFSFFPISFSFFLSFFPFPFLSFPFSQILLRNSHINRSNLLMVQHSFLSFYKWIHFTFDLTSFCGPAHLSFFFKLNFSYFRSGIILQIIITYFFLQGNPL